MSERKLTTYFSLLIGAIFFLLIANIGLFLRMVQLQKQVLEAFRPPQVTGGLELGAKAPDFKLVNLQGQEVTLEDFYGKDLLIVFSSTTCPACQRFWPMLSDFHHTYPDVEIVMVSLGTKEENNKMILEHNFDFQVLSWEEEIAQEYKIPGTPFVYLLSPKQEIAFAGFSNDMENLEAELYK